MKDASEIYPLHINTIREVINDPAKLRGLRTTIRYEPYRMARNEELCVIVYRRLIAAIDWVELLAERMGGLSTEDRIALVKACFGPLTLFKCSARTASVTENENMLCLCNFAYVPREISKAYSDAYHLDNGLVERLLNDLVGPFRRIHLTEEEVICLSAIIVLNPMARDLSEHAAELCFQLRNRICATLYHIVKECRADCNPNIWFGNLLLFLPIVASLANAMCENLRFAQTFSLLGGIPLLTSLFGCFPVEPFTASESEMAAIGDVSNADKDDASDNNNLNKCASHQRKTSTERGTQTDAGHLAILHDQLGRARKRRLGPSDSLAEEGTDDFRLFKAPCSYTLTEMFDDRINEEDAKDDDDEIMVTSAENDGITTTATATCSSSSQTGTERKSRKVQAAIQEQQQTGNTDRTREVHAVQYQLQQQQQQTAGNAERSREVQAVQCQLQQQQQQTAGNAGRSREVQAVQYQLQQQQQQTAGNAGRSREVQAVQYLHDQHQHNHHVQPPSTQIQQLCLYDGSSSTSATSCRATGTTTASTLGMPSKFTAGTNLQEQQQISYPQMVQPYGMGMPSTMASCQNWGPIAYYPPGHHQQQYYGEFWHHQQNPGICATNSNLSQLIWPTTAMAPTVPSASTTTFSGQMPMVKQYKRRATLASVSTSAGAVKGTAEFSAQNAVSNVCYYNYPPTISANDAFCAAQYYYPPPPPNCPNQQQQPNAQSSSSSLACPNYQQNYHCIVQNNNKTPSKSSL
ncbi:hypothetical protein niasHT_008607 [Heterodera trifolii]|uniref:NR LBD domain-containing protein n=1 Tax=Heterodera trifolii TaxID=157864 RepID=A0ABD2LWE1_9BILA